ncbi:MAG: hypothetical protein GY866_29725 [Proteobacteria bacterium]|nr:hypothetical protein [Pseudomonadota bacterium]
MSKKQFAIDVVDVSENGYAERLVATSLQGLANRGGPLVHLDCGVYDDVETRTTNEVFIPEDIWISKYRDTIGNQDRKNLEYYQSVFDLEVKATIDLKTAVKKHAGVCKGIVVWDPGLIDTVNIALMMGGLEDLLVVDPESLDWIVGETGLEIKEDLRGRWDDKVALYQWAFENLLPRCAEGKIACVEPGWSRPEFTDYIVQNKIFVYSLATQEENTTFSFGQKLIMMLVGGPYPLRNLIFNLRLDGPIKQFGLFLMGLGSKETRLATRIQRAVKAKPFPTIFGWHTRRDDEFAFMLHLSANNLRLVPSHLAGNFSFHSQLPAPAEFVQKHATPESVKLEENKTYLTFTLSDGDQLVLMHTAELGNWHRKERGKVPFNWEMQPLLVEIAPALLGRYYSSLTDADYMVAGPSGAGYTIPPLMSNLREYLRESADVCERAGVKTMTSYIGDPSTRVVKEHGKASGNFLGFLGGYLHFGRIPRYLAGDRAFVANSWPPLDNIGDSSEQTLAGVRKILERREPTPRFIGVHLFAYRTTVTDVYDFVQTLDPDQVKVVKADEFLLAAAQYLKRS